MSTKTGLIWLAYFLLALILVLPSSSSLRPTSLFVSSWKLETNDIGRPRTKANGRNFDEVRIGRGRFQKNNIAATSESSSFSDPHLVRKTNDALRLNPLSAVRGGADSEKEDQGDSVGTVGISISLFLTYLTVMGAKCALPSTLSMLASANSGLVHHHPALSRQDVISRLLAFSTLSIAAGKLFLGPVIDSLGGVTSLRIALSTLCLCLCSIGLGSTTCPTLTSVAMYWIVIDFAFSSCWAACVKTIRDCMPEDRWSGEIGRLAMAARMGNAISFAFFAWLLQWAAAGVDATKGAVNASWRWVFRASGIVQLIPLVMLSYFGRKKGENAVLGSTTSASEETRRTTLRDSLAILYQQSSTPEFWLHLISRSIIMVLVSFLLFIPSYMVQCFEMSSASSARVGSVFAVGCLLAVSTLAERTYPSVSASYRSKAFCMLGFLALSSVCLALQTSFLQNILSLSSVLGTLLMFLFGFSLAIPFYLPSSMFALKRGGKDGSATIADAFDVCGFALLAVFNGLVARVLDVSGSDARTDGIGLLLGRKQAWLPVFRWMLGGSITAMISLFGAVWLEGGRFDEEHGE